MDSEEEWSTDEEELSDDEDELADLTPPTTTADSSNALSDGLLERIYTETW